VSRIRAEHRLAAQPQIDCSEYSFNTSRYASHYEYGSGTIPVRTQIHIENYDNISVTPVKDDVPDYEDKISYNALFWPFVQEFKEPRVFSCENNPSLEGCKELLQRPVLPHWEEALVAFDSELEEESMTTVRPVQDVEGIITDSEPEVSTEDLISRLENLDHDHVARLPGCYPLVMPFVSAVTGIMWKLSNKENSISNSSSDELSSKVSPDVQVEFDMFTSALETVKELNTDMESSHVYHECGKKQWLGMMGSYLGVSMGKDLQISECETKEQLPQCLTDFLEYLANNSDTNQEFQYENLTVDSLIFNYDDYSLTMGDYNMTLENVIEDYNITETAMAKIKDLTEVTHNVERYKDSMVSKLRSEFDREYDNLLRSPSEMEQDIKLDIYSPDMKTINMLRRHRMKFSNEYRNMPDDEVTDQSYGESVFSFGFQFSAGPPSTDQGEGYKPSSNQEEGYNPVGVYDAYFFGNGTNSSLEDIPETPEELFKECYHLNTSNIQRCWEETVRDSFKIVDGEFVNSYLAQTDFLLITFSSGALIMIAHGVQMLSLVSFIMYQPVLSMIYGSSFSTDNPVSRLPCLYDIIMEEDLTFDTGTDVIEEETSLLKVIVEPFGRDNFSSLPIRLLNATSSIFSDPDQNQVLVQGLTNLTTTFLDKFSSTVEEGELADKIAARSIVLRNWLLRIDVVKVLEAFVRLVKEIYRAIWKLRSGNWPEMVSAIEEMFKEMQGEHFWTGLGKVMGKAVVKRWGFIHSITKEVVEPLVRGSIENLEWLVDDVEGNLAKLAEYVSEMDLSKLVNKSSDMGGVARDVVCGEHPEDVLPALWESTVARLTYLEPSMEILSKESLGTVFSLGEEDESELARRIHSSGITKVFQDIQRPLLDLKQSLLCHRDTSLEKKFWQYVLH